MYLLNRSTYKGYTVGRDTLGEGDFQDVEATASPNVQRPTIKAQVEEDEIYRVGQGQPRGPEYTEGRFHATIYNSGSTSELPDQSDVAVVILNGQDEVMQTVDSFKYSQVKQGSSDRQKRVTMPEMGPVIGNPKAIGLAIQTPSSTFTVDLSASSTNIELDAIQGTQK